MLHGSVQAKLPAPFQGVQAPGGSMTLMQEMNQKALELGVPLSAHIDLTFRCNERCIHCYLDHED